MVPRCEKCNGVKTPMWVGGNTTPRRIELVCPACEGNERVGKVSDTGEPVTKRSFPDADLAASLQMSLVPEEKDIPDCPHTNVQFLGWASLIGNYYCMDCGKKFTPQEYNQMTGFPHRGS